MKQAVVTIKYEEEKLNAMCHNGDSCHVAAPRGSKTGTQGLKGAKERSVIPQKLCEHLTSEEIENYMLSTISSVMHSTVKDSENRIARAMYKLAVETSKLSHVIAYSHGVDEEALRKLQAKCTDEVKRINGTVTFEDAYR